MLASKPEGDSGGASYIGRCVAPCGERFKKRKPGGISGRRLKEVIWFVSRFGDVNEISGMCFRDILVNPWKVGGANLCQNGEHFGIKLTHVRTQTHPGNFNID